MKDIVEQLDEIETTKMPRKPRALKLPPTTEERSDEGGGGFPMETEMGMGMGMNEGMEGGDPEVMEFEALVAEFDDDKKRRLCEWLESQVGDEAPAGLGSSVNDEGEMD